MPKFKEVPNPRNNPEETSKQQQLDKFLRNLKTVDANSRAQQRLEQVKEHLQGYKEWKSSSPDDSPDKSKTFKEVILGWGSTTADYIGIMKEKIDTCSSVILGHVGPWHEKRGPGVISQSEDMIDATIAPTDNPKFMDRKELSEKKINPTLENSGIAMMDAEVAKVSRDNKGWYKITYVSDGKEQTIYAQRVFDGMGLGEHIPLSPNENPKVMNIDDFTRCADNLAISEQRPIEIIVVGSNAGGGAAFDALRRNYKVKWITGPGGAKFSLGTYSYATIVPYYRKKVELKKAELKKETDPSKIKGLQLQIKAFQNKLQKINDEKHLERLYHPDQPQMLQGIAQKFKDEVTIEELHEDWVKLNDKDGITRMKNGRMKVKLANGGAVTGDYVVYAIGLKRKKEVLDETIRLEPLVDHNRLFTDDKKTVLGVQSKDGTFIGIGTGAERTHHDVTPDMINVGKTLSEGLAEHSMTTNRLKMEAALAGGRSDDSKCRYAFDNRNKVVADIILNHDCIADYKLSAEEKEKEPHLQEFTYLSEALAARIFESRKEPDLRNYSSKEDDLLPPGPEHGASLPNGKPFEDYWKKQLEALDHRLSKRKHQLEQLKKYVDSVRRLDALDPDTRKEFANFEQIWRKKIDAWKLRGSDPDTRDLYEPKLQDTEETIEKLRDTIGQFLRGIKERLSEIESKNSASMQEVLLLHTVIFSSAVGSNRGCNEVAHSLPLPWELKQKVARKKLGEPFQELGSALRGLQAGLEQAFPDWIPTASSLNENQPNELSKRKKPVDNTLQKLQEQCQTIGEKWDAACRSLEATANMRNHLLRASDEQLLKFIQEWEVIRTPTPIKKNSFL